VITLVDSSKDTSIRTSNLRADFLVRDQVLKPHLYKRVSWILPSTEPER
jgi:hypothetical protein